MSAQLDSKYNFHIADYVVFAVTILISIGIGIFYALTGGRQRTTSEYLMGGRIMSFIPVAISMMVSFESSIMMLGIPAEGYVYGVEAQVSFFSSFLAHTVSAWIVVPLLHPLKVTSAYEYLEYRFNSRAVRLLGTGMGMLNYTWYMGIVLFGPAVALQAVLGFPLYTTIIAASMVTVIYTSIGGLKAVIWTDVFQSFIMFSGVFAILIKGTMESGGSGAVLDTAVRGGRLNYFNFEFNLTKRHTFWNLVIGSFIKGFAMTFNQSSVQRISSTKTVKEARRVMLIVAPLHFFALSLAIYEGVVAYAYYEKMQCDPFASKQLTNANQVIPLIVTDLFANYPGMPGLFLASLFAACVSTLSSGLSSLSALAWSDIVHPMVGEIPEWKATLIAKISVVLFGCVACGIAFLISLIGGTLMQISSSLLGAFAAPLTGMFFLGCFCPRANSKGAFIGGVVSFILASWLSLGMNFAPGIKKEPWLQPASVAKCYPENLWNVTTSWTQTTEIPYTMIDDFMTSAPPSSQTGPQGIEKVYTLSYLLLPAVGIFGCILIGYIASILTGGNKPGEVNPRYLLAVTDSLLIFLPKSARKALSKMGTQFMKPEYAEKFPPPPKRAMDMIQDVELDPLTKNHFTNEHDTINGNSANEYEPNKLNKNKETESGHVVGKEQLIQKNLYENAGGFNVENEMSGNILNTFESVDRDLTKHPAEEDRQ